MVLTLIILHIIVTVKSVPQALDGMSEEEFRCQYRREKPETSDELVFYCRSGRRSTEALNQALKLGYVKYVFINH